MSKRTYVTGPRGERMIRTTGTDTDQSNGVVTTYTIDLIDPEYVRELAQRELRPNVWQRLAAWLTGGVR